MAPENPQRRLVEVVKQSPPVDTSAPYEADWVKGKTILITGGASGFGEGFFRKWAAHGATVIIGDINEKRGQSLVAEVNKTTGGKNHFLRCDVTNWQSQVDFFRRAAELSPTGGIDTVVANAGIADTEPVFEIPTGLDQAEPKKPNLKVVEVDLIGVLYTAHLAFFWLQRNPRSPKASPTSTPGATPDRHLLLIGSVASIGPIPGQALYGTSKHGVLGLFRALRSSQFFNGIRVNMLCPYFIDTPIVPAPARILLAGGAMGTPEDVIDAGTRLVADSRIVGRALVIGPKVKVSLDNEFEYVTQKSAKGKDLAVWEAFADDFEELENFSARFVRLLNAVERQRGWVGWTSDVFGALTYPIWSFFRR